MDRARVCVIHSSLTIRETVGIVLGERCEVRGGTPADYLRDPSAYADADVLITGDDLSPEALAALPRGTRLLWLQESAAPPPTRHGVWAKLPKAFHPADLRRQVQALLQTRVPTAAGSGVWTNIDYPILPIEATTLAWRAARTDLPVVLCGEAGVGKGRLARAIHSLRGDGRFISLSAASCTRAVLLQAAAVAPGSVTLYVNDLCAITADGQQVLREILDCGGLFSTAGWHAVRLICGTATTFDGLAEVSGLERDLYYRLSVLPITLPPLRERSRDVPALVNHLAEQLARSLSLGPVSFTPAAMERLQHYLWFGNLAELETVLTRTIALTQGPTIDAADLLFGYTAITPRTETGGPSRPEPDGAANDTVDLVINELAHEFKNPMVTIKTVTQHLEHLLQDEQGRQQVARLTGEAVDRMDRTLENLLQFTRFGAPVPDRYHLDSLLDPCLTDLTPEVVGRRLLLDYQPAAAPTVYVDGSQIGYALENLARLIIRGLPEGETLSIRCSEESPLTFEFAGTFELPAGKLGDLLGHGENGNRHYAPLGLVFAKALIERNGGSMDTHTAAERTRISIRLPGATAPDAVNGNAARFNR